MRRASIVAVDIETDCGPIGSPPEWEPSDGAVRLVQVAWPEAGGAACAVVDCYAVPADPLVRLLAEPGRTVVAHNIRYEQQWLSFHHGIGPFADPVDTSIAFRIFECVWALQDPAYVRQDARLETVARRVVGVDKGAYGLSFWGAEPLAPEQLRYAALDALALLDIAQVDRVDRCRLRLRGPGARRQPGGVPRGRAAPARCARRRQRRAGPHAA